MICGGLYKLTVYVYNFFLKTSFCSTPELVSVLATTFVANTGLRKNEDKAIISHFLKNHLHIYSLAF